MVVGSIISIIFIYYCDENKRNKAKLSVCRIKKIGIVRPDKGE